MLEANAKRVVPWIVAIALFMETLDTTIITTAIPSMAELFGIDPINLRFALTSYLLSLALFIPVSGWVADKWGAQHVFVLALFIFTISSIGCGMSTNLTELIIGRIFQGIGGAFMMPIGRLIILRTFSKSELIHAMNFVAMPALLGPLLGPLIGGFITTYYSWPWIFYVNVPIGILGVICALRFIQNWKVRPLRHFDLRGFLLFGLSLAVLFLAFESVGLPFFSKGTVGILFLSGTLGFLLFYWHYKTTKNPILNLKLFLLRTFFVAAAGNVWIRLGISSVVFLLPLFLQIGYGITPFYSGLLTAAWPVGMVCSKFMNKFILNRLGFRKMLCATALLLGAFIAFFFFIESIHIATIITLVFVGGVIASLQYTGMNTLYYADVPQEEISHATSIVGTLQQLSMGWGVSMSALVLNAFVVRGQSLSLGEADPFRYTFAVMGIVSMLSVFLFLRLKAHDGKEMT